VREIRVSGEQVAGYPWLGAVATAGEQNIRGLVDWSLGDGQHKIMELAKIEAY
jgi:hypothetical protein